MNEQEKANKVYERLLKEPGLRYDGPPTVECLKSFIFENHIKFDRFPLPETKLFLSPDSYCKILTAPNVGPYTYFPITQGGAVTFLGVQLLIDPEPDLPWKEKK